MRCEVCGRNKTWCRGPLEPEHNKRTSGKKRGRRSDALEVCGNESRKKSKDAHMNERSSTHEWGGLAHMNERSSTHEWGEDWDLGEEDGWDLDTENPSNVFSLNGLTESLPTLHKMTAGCIPTCSSDCCGTVWQEIVKVLDSRGEDAECTVGRLSGNDIIFLQDPLVSRVHAKIVRSGSAFYLQDLQSSNGTTVSENKMKPNEIHSLIARDVVMMGKSLFHVEDGFLY